MMADRDNMVRQFHKKDFPSEGKWAVVDETIEHPDYPANVTKRVRLETQMWSVYEMVGPETMKQTIFWINNPGGYIPSAVINSLAGKMPAGIVENYRKYLGTIEWNV